MVDAGVRYGYPETTSEVEGELSTLLPLGDKMRVPDGSQVIG